ncbi:MAG: alpha/beta hydrolase [Planctomycetes bacterium]|nr:alpha/beta hydrolase [Planctomycetota bacterium]
MRSKLNSAVLFPSPHFQLMPEDFELTYETFAVPVDGARLHTWFFPADNSSATVIVCGGNTDNKQLYLTLAQGLVKAGYNAVLFDYRGFGFSAGEPDLWSLAEDTVAVLHAVRSRPDTARVALMGISLGSVTAVAVAAAAPDDIDALILEGVFNPSREARRRVGGFLAALGQMFFFPSSWNIEASVARLRQPVLFLHGTQDTITPTSGACRIFATSLAAPAPRFLWLAEECGHSPGIAGAYGDAYTSLLQRFLDTYLRGRRDHPFLRAEWAPAGEDAIDVRLSCVVGPTRTERWPAQITVITEEEPKVHRVWFEPAAPPLRLPLSGRPLAVAAMVPAASVEAMGKGWDYSGLYIRSTREWRELVSDASTELQATQERLASFLAGPVHPERRPWFARVFRELARVYEARGDPALAAQMWRRVLELLPDHPFACPLFQDASWELGFDASVLGALEHLVKLEPNGDWQAQAKEWNRRCQERRRALDAWEVTQRTSR